ncbi:alanine--tRNA ligase, chloroplastic/mitochondrial-like [Camellia sinensis]|uniref:alanine--tRNA ligase, chloroplastic/mitochondrial-like n=1 Tax=Camellia sinensis TaxID=4442 RepID=UPI0010363597|nr:alanine--tRNA ligase, chloroplastic/mitochondrial-like [Camellia sinensis]
MKGLKMELSLHCMHGAKPLLPFLTSRPISRYQPRCQLALSIGCRDHFPSKHSKIKGARKVNFTTRITSASIQPMTEELVEDKSKDVPTSGDSIRWRFLDFYAS